eukprot:1153971-Pelagomonas_calceolata.AAC.1
MLDSLLTPSALSEALLIKTKQRRYGYLTYFMLSSRDALTLTQTQCPGSTRTRSRVRRTSRPGRQISGRRPAGGWMR